MKDFSKAHVIVGLVTSLLCLAVVHSPASADSTPECNIGPNDDPGPDGNYGTPDDVQLGTTECGAFSYAPAKNSTAIGISANASGENSTALGENSYASGANSVALGEGSRADQDDTVSVGAFFAERRITNVAEGQNSTDAVNVNQLISYSATYQGYAQAYTDTREAAIRDDIATGDQASLTSANAYTDARESAIRADAISASSAILAEANTYTDVRAGLIRSEMQANDDRIEGLANSAQSTANSAIDLTGALGEATAAILGGGAEYDPASGAVSAPVYTIGNEHYADVGSAFAAIDGRLEQIDGRVGAIGQAAEEGLRRANGGIAAAMALSGTMIVPDSTVSVNFNLATYRGEQGFSGALVVRASPKVYVSGGFAGSTVKGSTGGKVGVAFGF